ncbi:MAG: hypothetical protein VKQ33_12065 [Candidatus Sericytochromatia bacterium]|nr:hypothetical protein [Candidatus Sericytochromatia bacterium]
MRTPHLLSITLLAATLAGCVNTTLRAVRDPAFAQVVYQHLLVRAQDVYDPEQRMVYEDAFAAELVRRGVRGKVLKFYEQFPPTRKVDEAAVAKLIRAEGLEGVLEVRIAASGSTRSHVPRSTTTTTSGQTDRSKAGRTVELRSTTTETGGYDVFTPWMRLEVRLVDAAKGEVAWVGYTRSSGPAQWLAESQASAVGARLVADGLLKTR